MSTFCLQFDRDAIQQSVRAWGSAAPLEKQQAFLGKLLLLMCISAPCCTVSACVLRKPGHDYVCIAISCVKLMQSAKTDSNRQRVSYHLMICVVITCFGPYYAAAVWRKASYLRRLFHAITSPYELLLSSVVSYAGFLNCGHS